MNSIFGRLLGIARSRVAGITLFFVLLVGTVGIIWSSSRTRHLPPQGGGTFPGPIAIVTPIPVIGSTVKEVTLNGELSQTKLIQGSQGIVTLDLIIDSPASVNAAGVTRQASDIVVVLDRSGSMSADNRLPYAKEAIRDLLGRLNGEDRFALVTFDSNAEVTIPLSEVTSSTRDRIWNRVAAIAPGSSTNISEALVRAKGVLRSAESRRSSSRVILLSDGQANMGITDPRQLESIAAEFTKDKSVLSAIGMGLGFNETLMSSLADHGTGNYSYLENLAFLGNILQKDLSDARTVYASSSMLYFKPLAGVTLTDAGGYPIERHSDGTVKIPTGQLLSATRKRFVLTFNVPTSTLGETSLGGLALGYAVDGGEQSVSFPQTQLQPAVLSPEHRDQALASVNEEVYRRTWTSNNLGMMQKKYSDWLRKGDREKAESAIQEYEQDLLGAESGSGLKIQSKDVKQKLADMRKELNEAFSGSPADQSAKQNRASKANLYDSIEYQRAK